MAFAVKAAKDKSGNKAVNAGGAPTQFLLEKKQLPQRFLMETQGKEFVADFWCS